MTQCMQLKELIVGMLSLISPPPDNSAYESVADAIIALEHTNIGPVSNEMLLMS